VVREPGMRNIDMALATERAIQHFKPQIVLLVGIAGGVKDVKIGDLLIATKAYGYESGKESADGFMARPAVESFSAELLARAQAQSRKDDWKKRTVDGASDAKVFIGPIAAGEKVVAGVDNPSFQHIKRHLNDTLGLEMEAIGFATALNNYRLMHGLAIRGISDMCEGKAETDQQNWQPVAAERAAAFAFELLYTLDASAFIFTTMDPKAVAKELYNMAFPGKAASDAEAENTAVASMEWIRSWFLANDPVSSAILDMPGNEAVKQIVFEQKLPKLLENEQFKQELDDKRFQNNLQKERLKNIVENSNIEAGGNVHIGDKQAGDAEEFDQKNVVKGSTIKAGGDFRLGDG
jgi:nucleoside phosphorylase